MRLSRDTVRIVVPPLLALGLVAVLVHPMAEPVPLPNTAPITAAPTHRAGR